MVTFFRYSLLIVISSFSLIFSQNHSLSFDGVDDYLSIPESDYFNNLGDFSFSIWIRLEENFSLSTGNSNSSNQFIINKDHHPTYGNAFFSLRIQNGGDGLPDGVVSLAWLFDPDGNNGGNDLTLHTDINSLLDNQWHYISCTRKESTGELKLYVDGNIVDSGVTLSGAISTPNRFIVGSHVFTDRSFFKGKVDNFNFWNLTLSQQEILSNMNTPLVGNESGLVGYWDFNEGQGSALTDLSGNGNNGTIYGASYSTDVPIIVQQPSPNHSLSFNGNDNWVDLNTMDDIVLSNMTYSFWINTIGSNNDNQCVINTRNGQIWIPINDVSVIHGADMVNNDGGSPWQKVSSPSGTITPGNWHHIVFSVMGDNRELYVDNILVSSSSVEEGFNGNYPYSEIGSEGKDGRTNWFRGRIDEASVWSHGAHANTVEYLFNYKLKGDEEGLISYWDFDDGEGTILSDLSGNGNNGQINGATWIEGGAPVEIYNIASISLSNLDTYIFPGYIGDTALVAVNADLRNIDLYSSKMRFTGFQGVLGFEGIITEGTPMGDADWNVVVNEQESVLITSNYGSTAINGEVTLFYLKFSVGDSLAQDTIFIELADIELNEEEDEIEIFDGSVNVRHLLFGDVTMNDDVSSLDAANILRYLVGTVEFDQYKMSAADVTMDESISALDASVIAQYDVELIQSLPHSEGTDGQGFLTINEGLEYQPGEILEVPVMLTGGNNLLSFEVDLTYNPNQVTVEGIDWSDQIDHFMIEENNEPGSVRVAGSGTTPDGQEGLFATLRLQVLETTTEQSIDLMINKIRINESAPVEDVMVSITQEVLSTDNATVPTVYALHQNYPNPFNPTTKISYDLPEASVVSLFIYDLMGREIRTMINSEQTAGFKNIQWNATDKLGKSVPAGMYIYTIQAGEFRQTRKMVLLK